MSGGGGQNTVETQSAPPQQFLNAYQTAVTNAQNVASVPYQPYQGQIVAGLSPDQQAGINTVDQGTQEIANAQGIANPYINSAAQYINNSTQPLWSGVQQFSPSAISQYSSPYTQQVLNSTMAAENNQDQQQQSQLTGNAVSQGAYGGDRAAIGSAVLSGQQDIANNQTNAGILNTGYQQALQEFNQQQTSQLGANEANSWLNSQAGYGMANLGNEAQSTALGGASALIGAGNQQLGIGGLEQTQAQAQLNVPYQQYLAAQAYPFQTSQYFANIAEGLGGASGGTSSTTSPGPSVASQAAGLGTAALGGLGLYNTAFGGASAAGTGAAAAAQAAAAGYGSATIAGLSPDATAALATAFTARGGEIPHRTSGGGIPDLSQSWVPQPTGGGGHNSIPSAPHAPAQQPTFGADLISLENAAKTAARSPSRRSTPAAAVCPSTTTGSRIPSRCGCALAAAACRSPSRPAATRAVPAFQFLTPVPQFSTPGRVASWRRPRAAAR